MKTLTLSILILLMCGIAGAQEITASYYTVASCLKESGQFVMANGKELRDDRFTCASWDYKFGTVLLVTNTENGRTVRVVCTDRGPSKRLYRMGRKLDLSKRAFSAIAPLERGVISIKIERIK